VWNRYVLVREPNCLRCCVPSLADRLTTKTSNLFPDRTANLHLENRIFRKKKEEKVCLSGDFLKSVSTAYMEPKYQHTRTETLKDKDLTCI